MNGSQDINVDPVHGDKGVAAPTNDPGSRINPAMVASQNGDIYLFGGSKDLWMNTYNDMGMFNQSNSMWT